jgi:hypothetical protein
MPYSIRGCFRELIFGLLPNSHPCPLILNILTIILEQNRLISGSIDFNAFTAAKLAILSLYFIAEIFIPLLPPNAPGPFCHF